MLGMLIFYDVNGAVVEIRRSQIMPLWLVQELGVAALGVRDETGEFITTREGEVAVVADFSSHEEAGGALGDYGSNAQAVGSATWPEWLHMRDVQACDLEFESGWSRHTPRGERPAFRLRALVNKASGHRRDRRDIEAAIEGRIAAKRAEAEAKAAVMRAAMPARRDAQGRFLPRSPVVVESEPADIRDLVGGPGDPLRLDSSGKTVQVRRRPIT